MPSLRRFVERLRERFVGPTPAAAPEGAIALTGASAVELVSAAAGVVWITAPTGRHALATGLGRCLGGQRVGVCLDAADGADLADLVAVAAARRAPLVLHLHTRARTRQATSTGGGHDSLHALADAGALVLVADTAQAAADLTLVAHRTAEAALLPVIVVQDVDLTAHALQDVALPTAAICAELLGDPSQQVRTDHRADEVLFGEWRPRVPRWLDADRPVLLGGSQPGDVFAAGAAGWRVFAADGAAAALAQASEAVSRQLRRPLPALHTHRLAGAHTVLVTQGAAAALAMAVSDQLAGRGERVGAIGVTHWRPLPAAALRDALSGIRRVLVIERTDTPLGDDPPLTRALRAVFGGSDTGPQIESVIWSPGGAPLDGADVAGLVRSTDAAAPTYVGLRGRPETGNRPKRQALQDALFRAYPALDAVGSRATERLDIRPEGAITLAVCRPAGEAPELAARVAAVLMGAAGGQVRTSPLGAGPAVDRVTWAPSGLLDAGALPPIDVLVVRPGGAAPPAAQLASGARLVLDPAAPLGGELGAAAASGAVVRVAVSDPTDATAWLAAAIGAAREALPSAPSDRKLVDAVAGLFEDPEASDRFLAALAGGPYDVGTQSVALAPPPSGVPATLRGFSKAPGALGNPAALRDRLPTADSPASPDPVLALGALPPAAGLLDSSARAGMLLPEIQHDLCTGCGACWTACPDAAVVASAWTPAALLDGAMALAAEAGQRTDALRPLAKGVAAACGAALRGESPPFTGGALLRAAGETALAGLPAARLEKAEPALAACAAAVEAVPFARSERLFSSLEKRAAGTGALLSLAADPDSCKSCGLCAAVCADEAIRMVPASVDAIATARADVTRLLALPDTASATMAQADLGAAAALLLGRPFASGITGADSAAAGSGPKLALRLVLAGMEAIRQPMVHASAEALDQARRALSEHIRSGLAGALPLEDLETLEEGVDALAGPETHLSAIAARLEGSVRGGRVSVGPLRDQVRIARALANARWLLAEGTTGHGAARALMVVAHGPATEWIGAFPGNPVVLPAMTAPPEMAAGLASGLQETLTAEAVSRAASLRAARGAVEPRKAAPVPTRWADLDEAEKRLCPPVLLVLGERELPVLTGAVLAVLGGDLPVKVVLLRNGRDTGTDPVGAALATGRAYVAQGSIADPDHLVDAVREAVRFPGPALISVLAPSAAELHRPAAELLDGTAALRSAVPHLRYDPDKGLLDGLDLADPVPVGTPAAGWGLVSALAVARAARAGKEAQAVEAAVAAEVDRRVSALKSAHAVELAEAEAAVEAVMAARVTERLLAMAEAAGNGGSGAHP